MHPVLYVGDIFDETTGRQFGHSHIFPHRNLESHFGERQEPVGADLLVQVRESLQEYPSSFALARLGCGKMCRTFLLNCPGLAQLGLTFF